MSQRPERAPAVLLVPGALALLAGLWTGLVRLGWSLPPSSVPPAAAHGPLMIGGFLGTLIGLERAVALAAITRRRWPYVAGALCGLGALALIVGAPPAFPRALITLGSLALVAIFVFICRRVPDRAHVTMGLGAVAWLAGNLVWISGAPLPHAAPWWVGFLVLTIAGERLELARLVQPGAAARRAFLMGIGLLIAGLALSIGAFEAGVRLAGAGLIALGAWLLRWDVAARTIRSSGLPRFIAACLLPGYAWLIVSGLLWLALAPRLGGGPAHDAMLHAALVGFVLSMIFGHAPIILPAVTGGRVAYRPRFYAHLALLHVSLVLRIVGDLAGQPALRQWGGLLNAAAVLVFLASTIAAVAAARAAKAAPA